MKKGSAWEHREVLQSMTESQAPPGNRNLRDGSGQTLSTFGYLNSSATCTTWKINVLKSQGLKC